MFSKLPKDEGEFACPVSALNKWLEGTLARLYERCGRPMRRGCESLFSCNKGTQRYPKPRAVSAGVLN
jgi:hypothetical protein